MTDISDLLARLKADENNDLKACLAMDLTAWMYARALLTGSDSRCSVRHLENLLARFELTAEMMRPADEGVEAYAPRSTRSPVNLRDLERQIFDESSTRGAAHPDLRPRAVAQSG